MCGSYGGTTPNTSPKLSVTNTTSTRFMASLKAVRQTVCEVFLKVVTIPLQLARLTCTQTLNVITEDAGITKVTCKHGSENFFTPLQLVQGSLSMRAGGLSSRSRLQQQHSF